MSESEFFWVTDEQVSEEVFEDLPVPSESTITKGRHLSFKRAITGVVKTELNLDPPSDPALLDTTYNPVKTFAIMLYKRLLQDDMAWPVDMKKDQHAIRRLNNKFGDPAVAGIGKGGVIH